MYIKHLNPEPVQYLNKNRAALVNWLADDDWELAGTFTFKNNVYEAQARRTFMHFWNVIDYRIFKNSAKRHNKRCERICFIEVGAGNDNWHYHVATKTPERLSAGVYERLIKIHWLELDNTGIMELTPINNVVRWTNYMSKKITAFNTDAFDAEASHIARH